ncbi:MAG: hypothetical protein ACI4RA_04400, partial [Kiritimatiellia bacterium]
RSVISTLPTTVGESSDEITVLPVIPTLDGASYGLGIEDDGTGALDSYLVEEKDGTKVVATKKKPLVAAVGDAKYATLIEACEAACAAGPGTTVTLLGDYTVETATPTTYLLPKGATLDLGGHTLTVPKQAAIFAGEDITIQNGRFEPDGAGVDYALWIESAAEVKTSVTVKNVTSDAGANVFNAKATFVDCSFDASSRTYYAVWGDSGADITIESGTYTASWRAVSSAETAEVAIKGGTYSSDVGEYVLKGIGVGVFKGEDGMYTVGPATNWIQLADTTGDWYVLNKDNDTLTVTTPEELAGLAKLVNAGVDFAGKTIEIDASIDLGCYNDEAHKVEWTPIGTAEHPFAGSFAMFNDDVIKNLVINEPAKDNQALFGVVTGEGTFTRVALENVDVTGKDNVAGLIAKGQDVDSVTECSVTGSIKVTGANGAGALFGRIGAGEITKCVVDGAEGSVVQANGCVGGLAAIADGGTTVTACTVKNLALASGSTGDNGLLVGRTDGSEGKVTYVVNNTVEASVAGTEAGGAAFAPIHGFGDDAAKPYAVAGTGVFLDENNLVISADKLAYGHDADGTLGKDYLAEGSEAKAHPDNDGTWVVEGKVVAMIGGKGYSTLQAAFDAAVDGDIVKLAADVTPDNTPVWPVCVANKAGKITLDLNGKNISGNNKTSPTSISNLEGDLPGVIFASGADLVLTDTVGNGKVVNAASNGHTIVAAAVDDTSRATQVTLRNGVGVETKCYATWSTTTADSKYPAKVTIKNATIDTYNFFNVTGRGELEVEDGSFKASAPLPFGGFTSTAQTSAVKLGGGVYDVTEQRSFSTANALPYVTTAGVVYKKTDYGYRVTLTDDEPADFEICLERADGKRIYGTAEVVS